MASMQQMHINQWLNKEITSLRLVSYIFNERGIWIEIE
jgi:hypothetical protein